MNILFELEVTREMIGVEATNPISKREAVW
jgi:hypothetical protein